MKKRTRKRINWIERLPYIKDMMRNMSDAQIAAQYRVNVKTVKDVRRKHGLARPEDRINPCPDRMPCQIAPSPNFDFHGDNLV